MSTYSPSLRLELIAAGDQAGIWGNTTNTNLGTLLEQAIAGVLTINLTASTAYTLSAYNGTSDQARNALLRFTGSPGAKTDIVIPTQKKTYFIKNDADQQLEFRTSGQSTGVLILPGEMGPIYCDGTNAIMAIRTMFPTSGGDTAGRRYAFGTVESNTADHLSVLFTGAYSNAIPATFDQGVQNDGNSAVTVINSRRPGALRTPSKVITLFTTTAEGQDPWKNGVSITPQGSIGYNTNYTLVNYNTTSDARLKTHVVPLCNNIESIKKLRPVAFDWVRSSESGEGFIAQELQKIPEYAQYVTSVGPDGDGGEYLGVDYGKLTPRLVAALQEAVARIEALEARLAALEDDNA